MQMPDTPDDQASLLLMCFSKAFSQYKQIVKDISSQKMMSGHERG